VRGITIEVLQREVQGNSKLFPKADFDKRLLDYYWIKGWVSPPAKDASSSI